MEKSGINCLTPCVRGGAEGGGVEESDEVFVGVELVDVACCVFGWVVLFLLCVCEWDVPQSVCFVSCSDGVGCGLRCVCLCEVDFVFGEGDLEAVVAELSEGEEGLFEGREDSGLCGWDWDWKT